MTNISLVSVVIPAFNAENTILETLQSASEQTHSDLEIIVVDDGSLDRTGEIIEAYRQTDPRVKLIKKRNGGVASARNAGIAASSADFIAFLDADDLWHPTKIAKQLAVLTASENDTALVYSPFRQIDVHGKVHGSSRNHRVDGWVINRHFYVNIVGNGSSILVRKRALDEAGGFSPVLQEHNAQGCEDLLLQLRIALRYQFATVPEYLVGYRHTPGNMSFDTGRMLRSGLLALTMVLAECPNYPELEQRGLLARTILGCLLDSCQSGKLRSGMAFILPVLKGRAVLVAKAALVETLNKIRGLYYFGMTLAARSRQSKSKIPPLHFYEYDPADMSFAAHLPNRPGKNGLDETYRTLLAMAPLDAAYRPEQYFGRDAVRGVDRPKFARGFLA